jgi:hypothetical protein
MSVSRSTKCPVGTKDGQHYGQSLLSRPTCPGLDHAQPGVVLIVSLKQKRCDGKGLRIEYFRGQREAATTCCEFSELFEFSE